MQDQSKSPFTDSDKDGNNTKGSILDCFKFASITDIFIALAGVFLALLTGASKAIISLLLGLAVSSFDARYSREEISERGYQISIYFIIVGFCLFIGMLSSKTLLRINAQRQGYNFRKAYLKALLQQEVSFYDKVNPMEFSSQVENDCKAVGDALDLKLEAIFYAFSNVGCALIISFLRSWQVALMIFAAAPIVFFTMYLYQKTIVKGSEERSVAYGKAGAIAEEALTNVKTVVSLGGEKTELNRYIDGLQKTKKMLIKNGFLQGMAFGSVEVIFLLTVAIICYITSKFIEEGTINPTTGEVYIFADIFTPLNAILAGLSQIPVLGSSINSINLAKLKARKILKIIENVKAPNTSQQQKIDNFSGNISFKNISFAYPTNPDKIVLQNFSVDIKANTKVAFVGESGSGKSTIIQLLQKFYELNSGKIEYDTYDLKTLDTSWLRRNLAYVGQEPVLFSMTIRDNLLLGKEDATEDELIEVLKKANAYDFVMNLDKKLDTLIGGGVSTHLSGGQKQRLAIARALLKDTRVLLLDEATSALDRLSEKEIQKTLDNLPGDRTIIIIAHRLSTIKKADQIIVLNKGQIEEMGKHEELMAKKGKYYSLQAAQASLEDKPIQEISRSASKASSRRLSEVEAEEEEEEVKYDEENENEEDSLLKRDKSSSRRRKSIVADGEKSKKEESFHRADLKRIWNLTKQHKILYLLGALGALGFAIAMPICNVLVSELFGIMVSSNDPEFRTKINLLCIGIGIGSLLVLLSFTIEVGFFTTAAESLIQSLRQQVFYKFLRMHMGWHDLPKNRPGNLVASLESDTTNFGQMTGATFGIILQTLLMVIVMTIFALIALWQAAIPEMIVTSILLFTALRLNNNEARAEEKAAAHLSRGEVLISEAINNIKTTLSLDAQSIFLKEYTTIITIYHDIKLKAKILNGFLEGGIYFLLYLGVAVSYSIGVHLHLTLNVAPGQIFIAVFAMMAAAFASTELFFIIPDTGKGAHSAHQIFNHLDLKSRIDIEDKTNAYKGKIKGNIEFVNVKFSYPTRNVEIFSDLSFKIEAGKQIGITGPSGCGKSTIMQLLLRLYDVDAGEILIEGVRIQEYDLQYLRKKIGIVSQEPVLFYGSIAYNLKYANEDITEMEMKEAARKANAYRFIESDMETMKKEEIPGAVSEGYERIVGSKGGQLSGGQKQRIAIARAILRKPNILLLDEATSALDAESESLVQDALNKLSEGLTTISVAHRLSTIQTLDEILVLKDGVEVERGRFDQLMKNKGYLYQLKEGSF